MTGKYICMRVTGYLLYLLNDLETPILDFLNFLGPYSHFCLRIDAPQEQLSCSSTAPMNTTSLRCHGIAVASTLADGLMFNSSLRLPAEEGICLNINPGENGLQDIYESTSPKECGLKLLFVQLIRKNTYSEVLHAVLAPGLWVLMDTGIEGYGYLRLRILKAP